jgi:hypothetical protein
MWSGERVIQKAEISQRVYEAKTLWYIWFIGTFLQATSPEAEFMNPQFL